MEASTDLTVKQSFVLKPEHLAEFWESLSSSIGNISSSAYCEDGITRQFKSSEALLNYPNPLNAKIQSISIRARSDDYNKSARIVFSNEKSGPIRFEADGPEDVVLTLKDSFLRQISRCKAWYDRFARLDLFDLMYGIGFAVLFIFMLLFAIGLIGSEEAKTSNDDSRSELIGWLIGIGFWASLAFVGLIISKIREKLFPVASFFWGDAAEHHLLLEKIRWTVVIGFIVSLLAGIVGTLIVSLA